MCTIEQTGINHVPVPHSITPNFSVQGAMDNFDEKNIQSGISGTHDTVMVLFQNNEKQKVEDYNPQLKGILDLITGNKLWTNFLVKTVELQYQW